MAKTLLLADDSVTIQKVVGISFASEDIEITTVDNGDDAVARARELVPDIVLADAVMPGLSGYEVCEALKADPALAHVPVILLTGTFEAFDAERAARAGAAGHVSKPFEAQTLVDRVKELLASAPAPAPAPPAVPEPPPESPVSASAPVSAAANASAPAFDFSDDEDFEAPALDAASAGLEAEPLEFDDSDAAFSFEEDDLAGALAAPVEPPPPGPDATQLMPPLSASEEEPVDPGDLAQATLLDPAAASGYDVSSSDLGPPAGGEDPVLAALSRSGAAVSERTPRPYGADPAADESPAFASATAELEVESNPTGPAPIEVASFEDAAPPLIEAPPLEADEAGSGMQLASEPLGAGAELEPEPLGASVDLEPEPLEATEVGAITDPFPEERLPQAAVAGADPVEPAPLPEMEMEPAAEPEPAVSGGESALTPALRRELSDTLEKIAWDAFGPVTEKIVREALERVEQVVWEVVPQIAETLIQEEIRRLKDSDDAE